MVQWISWIHHPVPDDVHGIFIKYNDGVYPDRYDSHGKRIYREGKAITGWRFIDRIRDDHTSIQCLKVSND